MPGRNRTGPWGTGPLTGWGAGYCAGIDEPGPARAFGIRGGGRAAFGGGRGRRGRHMYYATGLPGWSRRWAAAPPFPPADTSYSPTAPPYPGAGPWFSPPSVPPQDEAESLKKQAEYLEEALAGIKNRLEDLEE